MAGSGLDWASIHEVPSFRLGRIAETGVGSPNFRFWLQAEVRARLIDVRLCSDWTLLRRGPLSQ